MREYHKIETVFERSTDGNKYLQLGKFRNPTVEFLKDLRPDAGAPDELPRLRVRHAGS